MRAQSAVEQMALKYLERGWSVIPIKPRGKTALKSWREFQQRHATPAEVHQWFDEVPDANIAIVTGELSNLVAVDIDNESGEAWLQNHGGDIATTVSKTSRGRHLLFRHPGFKVGTKAKIAPGIDVRGDGGYIVAPPSVHESGSRYEWQANQHPAELPAGILSALQGQALVGSEAITVDIKIGQRNSALARLAGKLLGQGLVGAEALNQLKVINAKRCKPPLTDSEVETIFRSIEQRENAKREAGDGKHRRSLKKLSVVSLADVREEKVTWLWQGYVPLAKLTVIDGDPGLGKSTLVLDLAARVSTGRNMPDGSPCQAGNVVVVSLEDGLADTVRPRLAAASADVSRIRALDEGLVLPDQIPQLVEEMQRYNARLVVIDPFMAALSSRVNSWSDQRIREALTPLSQAATDTGAAIVVVRHLNKKQGQDAMYRGGGSIGLAAQARAAYLVAKDPENPADGRVLAAIKSNLAKPPASMRFRIIEAQNQASMIEWGSQCALTAEKLLSPRGNQSRPLIEAEEFLVEMLSEGPVPTKEVVSRAINRGLSRRTLDRARASAGVITTKAGLSEGWNLSLGRQADPRIGSNPGHSSKPEE